MGLIFITALIVLNDKSKMYGNNFEPTNILYSQAKNSMFVSELVLRSILKQAKKSRKKPYSDYTEYNYVFTNLSKNLKKEANGK